MKHSGSQAFPWGGGGWGGCRTAEMASECTISCPQTTARSTLSFLSGTGRENRDDWRSQTDVARHRTCSFSLSLGSLFTLHCRSTLKIIYKISESLLRQPEVLLFLKTNFLLSLFWQDTTEFFKPLIRRKLPNLLHMHTYHANTFYSLFEFHNVYSVSW